MGHIRPCLPGLHKEAAIEVGYSSRASRRACTRDQSPKSPPITARCSNSNIGFPAETSSSPSTTAWTQGGLSTQKSQVPGAIPRVWIDSVRPSSVKHVASIEAPRRNSQVATLGHPGQGPSCPGWSRIAKVHPGICPGNFEWKEAPSLVLALTITCEGR
jgi:hypothetical protein